ncbi:hypothetical protein BaRGS_00014541, partial [Batillaria attramentaria]
LVGTHRNRNKKRLSDRYQSHREEDLHFVTRAPPISDRLSPANPETSATAALIHPAWPTAHWGLLSQHLLFPVFLFSCLAEGDHRELEQEHSWQFLGLPIAFG